MIKQGIEYYRNGATRAELIQWLSANDRNGVYGDAESIQEFGQPATLDELRECLQRALTDYLNL